MQAPSPGAQREPRDGSGQEPVGRADKRPSFEASVASMREGLRVIEDREAQDSARLHALREAARVGMADVDAGRFRSFASPAALGRHLTAIAGKAIGGGRAQ